MVISFKQYLLGVGYTKHEVDFMFRDAVDTLGESFLKWDTKEARRMRKCIDDHDKIVKKKLKPCPFCGKVPELVPWGMNKGVYEFCLMCDNNDCPLEEVCSDISDNVIDLIDKWNTRA